MGYKYFASGQDVTALAIDQALQSIVPTNVVSRQVFNTAGDFTYTPSAGVTSARVYMTGGGAPGSSASNGAPGGGSSATAIFEIAVSGPMTGTVGAAGGSTTFNGQSVAGATGVGPGATPAITNALIINGQPGQMGFALDIIAATSIAYNAYGAYPSLGMTEFKQFVGGNGAASFWGGGGVGSVAAANGASWNGGSQGTANAQAPGSGGAGKCGGIAAGAGAAGCVVIEEYA